MEKSISILITELGGVKPETVDVHIFYDVAG